MSAVPPDPQEPLHLSTHVLDAARGRPAAGVAVRWESLDAVGAWVVTGVAITDGDGRVAATAWELVGPVGAGAAIGRHRLVFDVADWSAEQDVDCFFPEVTITFVVEGGARAVRGGARAAGGGAAGRYHVPLLLSPYAYSTYRGS